MKKLMAPKKDKILNLVVDSRYKDILRKYAEAKGVSISQVIRDFVDKQLVVDENFTRIILNIPNETLKETQKLESWLNLKTKALMNYFRKTSP